METKQISVNGQLVSYKELLPEQGFIQEGKPPCSTVLILHGWGSSSAHWIPMMQKLHDETGFRILALDFPGFGASALPPKDWSLDDYVQLTDSFIQKFKLEKVHLLGHSFGGRVILKLAAEKKKYMENVILTGGAGIEQKSTSTKGKTWIANLVRPLFRPRWMQGLRRKLYKIIGADPYYLDRPELKEIYSRVIDEDLMPLLEKNTYKTLLLWGEQDTATPLWHGKLMAEKMPNAQLHTFPNAGHYVFLDEPEEFLKLIVHFVSSPLIRGVRGVFGSTRKEKNISNNT